MKLGNGKDPKDNTRGMPEGGNSSGVAEAEKYVSGKGADGVNVETGWGTDTKGTGKFNDA